MHHEASNNVSRDPALTNVRRFKDLILHRVREVLLVSSPYDAFILEEDGPLTDQVFMEYQELSLSAAPRFTHAPNAEVALELLQERRFDLVLAMVGLADLNVNEFGRQVKKTCPGCPVILLSLDHRERQQMVSRLERETVDGVFVWTGDTKILLAIIKYVEDRLNVEHDVKHGNVRVIIMIEDSVRYYSSFLRTLYRELMNLARLLYSEGHNKLHRLMYMRSRPKILHATSYEEASELFLRFRHNMLAVISDIGIPRRGKLDPEAGLEFAKFARHYDRYLPILLQSADIENREKAAAINVTFLDKNNPSHLAHISEFLKEHLGFGDFVFRQPDGTEIDRARDLGELEEKLARIPVESLVYHASRNHFSIWLMARSEFELAEELKPKKISDFGTPEECRTQVLQALREQRQLSHRGVIADFDQAYYSTDLFARIGDGDLGGKARGIAFLNLLLARTPLETSEDLPVCVPKTIVLTTDEFDRFLVDNDLAEFAYNSTDDQETRRRFLAAQLSNPVKADLRFLVEHMDGPLAVRSSSLLEDSLHQPFAGIYTTLMIPNNEADAEVRLRNLSNAIKLILASTFCDNARSYLKSTGNRIEEEKMAVIVQKVVGRRHGPRFYPNFSGVAQSHNFYPIGPQRSEDGIVHVGLGLGRIVVDEGCALRFSPRHPQVLPQLANLKAYLDSSQRGFWALDLESRLDEPEIGFPNTLKCYELTVAEEDQTLDPVASVYSPEDEQIREDLSLKGPRVLTLANILKHKAIPLPETLISILRIAEAGLGCPVEIEFAVDMGDWGLPIRRGRQRLSPRLFLLQVRPFAARAVSMDISPSDLKREEILVRADLSLGHGVDRSIHDIVYVRREGWDASLNGVIAREVGWVNERLTAPGRPYVLIGPGRWGTADPWLGIPVQWAQISGARVIIEASPKGYNVDPSQGTHFFHNITSLGIGYLTLPPGADKEDGRGREFLDWKWLDSQPASMETAHLRCVTLEDPLLVMLDGRRGNGLIGKNAAWQKDLVSLSNVPGIPGR